MYKLIAALFIFAYGIMFIHLAVVTIAVGRKESSRAILAAIEGVFGLLCIPGAAGIYLDKPGAGFYIASFVLMILLAPLGTAYALEYLGDAKRRALFLRPVLALTALVMVIGLICGLRGLHWRKVVCMAYAVLILSYGTVGILELRELSPFMKLPAKLRIFFAFYWAVVFQIALMLFFQFFELIPIVHVLWMVCNVSLLALIVIIGRNKDIDRQIGQLASEVRYEKSRLVSVNVAGQLEELNRLMVKEKLYARPNLKITDVAETLTMTGPQLSELLNRHQGQSFSSYINRRRIDMAKELLLSSQGLSILDIAFECGFSSKSAFNAAFQKLTGLSPSKFRERGPES